MDPMVFQDRGEGIAFLKEQSKQGGNILSILRSKPKKTLLQCVKGGQYRTHVKEGSYKRASSSMKTSCPYLVVLRQSPEGSWIGSIVEETHNHPP